MTLVSPRLNDSAALLVALLRTLRWRANERGIQSDVPFSRR